MPALDDAFIAPITDEAYGAGSFPPVGSSQWDSRAPLQGAELEAGGRFTIFVILETSGNETAGADGFVLRYSVDGRDFEKENSTAFVVDDEC